MNIEGFDIQRLFSKKEIEKKKKHQCVIFKVS